MYKKDHLTPLVRSLTPAEKKYFVQFSQLRNDDKSYIRLYDCVLRDGEYNADKLSKELKKTKANLAHEKEYLIEIVLRALRNFHDKHPQVKLHNLMSEVVLLKEKGQYQLAINKNHKAQRKAATHSRFDAMWNLLNEEKFLLLKTLPLAQMQPLWGDINRSMCAQTEYLQTMNAFYHLGLQIQEQFLKIPAPISSAEKGAVKKILAHPLFGKRFNHPYFRFQQHYLSTHLYAQLKQRDKMLFHMRHALRIIEGEPLRIQADIMLYVGCINAYIISLLGCRRFSEFFKFMERLKNRCYRSLPFNQNYLDQHFKAYYFYYMFDYFLHNRFSAPQLRKDVRYLLRDFEALSGLVRKQFNDAQWLQMQRNAAGLYFFFLHDDDAALRWVNSAINTSQSAVVNQIFSLVKILRVLIHAQKGNYQIIPSLVKSTRLHIKKYGPNSVADDETLSFVLHLSKLHNQQERQQAFSQLKQQYTHLQKNLPETRSSFGRIFYELWVERNLQ